MYLDRGGITRSEVIDIIDIVAGARGVQEAVILVRDRLSLEHITYFMAVPRELSSGPFLKSTYSAGWIANYVLRGYLAIDPIMQQGFATTKPFSWDELELDARQQAFMEDAHEHGISNTGYCVPIIDRFSRRALLNLTSRMTNEGWKKFIAASTEALVAIAHAIHRRAILEMDIQEPDAPALAPREIDCLLWTARGKDAKGIAQTLGISEFTVRSYLRTARQKLECRTLSQAVAKSVQRGLINP